MRRLFATAALLTFMATGSVEAGFPVPDGSFEQENAGGTNTYKYNPIGGAWSFTGNSGVINGSSLFGNPLAQAGVQLAFLQTNPNLAQGPGSPGVISETFTLGQGTYSLSLFEAARSGFATSSYTIQANGITIGGDSASSTSFVNYTTSNFNFAGGSLTLTFTSTGSPTQDSTTFLDNVTLSAVPEPASFAMLGFGLLASGGFYARKARRNRN